MPGVVPIGADFKDANGMTITHIQGGLSFTVQVTLDAAPTSDLSVSLSVPSGSPVSVPATLTVTAGNTTGTATATSSSVSSNQTIQVTASANGGSVTASMLVVPSTGA